MRIGAVITIVGAHDARNAVSRPTVPVPDGNPFSVAAFRSAANQRSPRMLRRTPRTKGRHHARTSRTPPGSEPCHHPAAPIP
jgi:hypothetical protein